MVAIYVPSAEEIAVMPLTHLPELLRRISNERAFITGDRAHGGSPRNEEAAIYETAIRQIRERLYWEGPSR